MARQPSTSAGNAGGSAPAAQQFDARRSGATEGVTRSGGQTVFAGSEAKGSKAKDSEAKAAGERSTDGTTVSPATGSATGNLWSGFAPETSSSLAAADASGAPQDSAVSSQAISMAVLALGLIGLLGGFLFAAVRRQRVHADRTSGRNER